MELYGTHAGDVPATAVEKLLEAVQSVHDNVNQLEFYGRPKEVQGFFARLLENMPFSWRGLVPELGLLLVPLGLAFRWVSFLTGAYCLVTAMVLHQVRDASSELEQLLGVKHLLMTLGFVLAVLGGFSGLDLLKNLTLYLVFIHLCSLGSSLTCWLPHI